jgi:hypothetical protein
MSTHSYIGLRISINDMIDIYHQKDRECNDEIILNILQNSYLCNVNKKLCEYYDKIIEKEKLDEIIDKLEVSPCCYYEKDSEEDVLKLKIEYVRQNCIFYPIQEIMMVDAQQNVELCEIKYLQIKNYDIDKIIYEKLKLNFII